MSLQATSPAAATVRLERLLPAPIARVWEFITDPELRGRWLASGPMELREGGRVALNFEHHKLTGETTPERYRGADMRSLGEVKLCEPPTLLTFTWNENHGSQSEVTFELHERGARTLMVITHRSLANADDMCSVAGGWHVHTDILEDVLSARAPRLFWARHAELESEYREKFFGADAKA